MPNLSMNHRAEVDHAGERPNGSAFRTMLAGRFASPDGPGRRLVEGMLENSAMGRQHHVLPGCRERCEIEQAEAQLACDAVDIVVLDLDGPVEAVLCLVKRLRAAAGQGVVFIGIQARHATDAACLYLSAVVDAVVDGPLWAGSLHGAIADALQDASDFQAGFGRGSIVAANEMRH